MLQSNSGGDGYTPLANPLCCMRMRACFVAAQMPSESAQHAGSRTTFSLVSVGRGTHSRSQLRRSLRPHMRRMVTIEEARVLVSSTVSMVE